MSFVLTFHPEPGMTGMNAAAMRLMDSGKGQSRTHTARRTTRGASDL